MKPILKRLAFWALLPLPFAVTWAGERLIALGKWGTRQLRRLLPVAVLYVAISMLSGGAASILVALHAAPVLAIRSAWGAAQ